MAITNILVTIYFIVTGLVVFAMACNDGMAWAAFGSLAIILGGIALLLDEVSKN